MLYNQSYACILRAKQVYLYVGYVWTYMSKYWSASSDNPWPKKLGAPRKVFIYLQTTKC